MLFSTVSFQPSISVSSLLFPLSLLSPLSIFLSPSSPSVVPIQRSCLNKFGEHYCCDGAQSGSIRQLVFTLQLTRGHGSEWWSARLVTNPRVSVQIGAPGNRRTDPLAIHGPLYRFVGIQTLVEGWKGKPGEPLCMAVCWEKWARMKNV